MWRALYTVGLCGALPLVLLRLWWRGRREPGYRRHVAERFGEYRDSAERPVLWVHAVSVGEARASVPLVRALLGAYPDHEVLVTCTTAAGREALHQVYGESVRIAWLPYDTPGAVRSFLEHFRPRLGVLMETEVWPNLLAGCREFGVPVLLANARMSEKSARGYARWAGLSRPAFAGLAAVCAQSAADAERLGSLGAPVAQVTGNLKFDAQPDADKFAAGRAVREALGPRKLLLLASTREGEEAMLLDALGAPPPDVVLMLVPRHPQRFDAVEQLLLARGFGVARRSRGEFPAGRRADGLGAPTPAAAHRPSAWLGDTMGEVDFYAAAADVALIGGSFAPLGGQNLIELCAAGVPVVLGPSMFNFAEATRLALEAGAAVQAADAPGAMRAALDILGEPAQCGRMGKAGLQLCAAHRGATARHLAACARLLQG